MAKTVKITLIISIAYLLIAFLRPVWERLMPGESYYLFYVLQIVLFVWIVVKFAVELARIVMHLKSDNRARLISLGVLFFAPLLAIANPSSGNAEWVFGKVEVKACRKLAHTYGTISFRADNTFDSEWKWFFDRTFVYDEKIFKGTYTQSGDTFVLSYERAKRPDNVAADTLILRNREFFIFKNGKTNAAPYYKQINTRERCDE